MYLVKRENKKTHHFRAIVEQKGVSIVQGIFYNWLSKSWLGCGDESSALQKQQDLVKEKIEEGFVITEFQEIPENTVDVYDKAKWHWQGDFPEGLDEFQAYVHTGIYFGWLIENNLISEEFENDYKEEIEKFNMQESTGPQIFQKCCDGVLMIENISEIGNRFSLQYFDFETGEYINDYDNILCKELPTIFHVKDNWENYRRMRNVINKQFAEWKSKNVN